MIWKPRQPKSRSPVQMAEENGLRFVLFPTTGTRTKVTVEVFRGPAPQRMPLDIYHVSGPDAVQACQTWAEAFARTHGNAP